MRRTHTYRKVISLLLGSVLWAFGLSGQATFKVDAGANDRVFIIDTFEHQMLLKDFAEVLFDPNNQFELRDFINNSKELHWQPLAQFPNTAFPSKEKPWLRIKLQNQLAEHQQWVFDCSFVNDSMLVYVIRENQQIDTFKLGRLVIPSETSNGSSYLRNLYTPHYPVYLELPKGEEVEVYVKLYPNFFKQVYLSPRLQSLEKMAAYLPHLTKQYVKGFLYSGLVLMFLFYNVLIYIFYRERANLYLALFALCFAAPGEYIVLTWMTKTWFLDFPFLIYAKLLFFTPLIYVFVAFFISAYLETKDNFPRVDLYMKILRIIGFSYLAYSISHFLILGKFQHDGIRMIVDIIALVLALIIFILMSIRIYRVKQTNVRFLLMGCCFLLLSQIVAVTLMILPNSSYMNAINSWIYPISMADIGILGLITILTLGLGHQSRETFKQKELLEQKDILKSKFFANISHEFRTPLTLIIGPIQVLLNKTKDPDDRHMLEIMQRNTNRQLQLVNSLLTLSKLEAGKMKLDLQAIEIVQYLKGILYSYETLAQQKEIELVFVSQMDELVLLGDPEKVEIILYNLLSNAFKYTKAKDQIKVDFKLVNNLVEISVSDTGTGIAEAHMPKLFDRFFHTAEIEEESSGIGLALALELAKLHEGDIQVSSTLGKGSTFTFQLPFKKTSLKAEPIRANKNKQLLPVLETIRAHKLVTDQANKKLTRLLLVEDNSDVRLFIRKGLESHYEIREAINGKEGLEAAFEFDPELIISDVMMPEMDGFELCSLLKSDLRTSHIPVILLTAKAAQEEKIEGLETGADDYLVKPFDAQELRARIQNLIKLRQNLRQRFATSILLKPAEIQTNSLDKTFLEKALAVMEDNMSNENFSIESLASALQMSKATLNRKFRALLDQSANEFIKTIRLQRAADLLEQAAGSVSEIAFQTGFRSTAYFVKSFKDHFGVTPGSFEKK